MKPLFACLVLLGLASQATAHEANNVRAIYEKNCYVCHGEKGHGDGPAGKTLGAENIIKELEEHAGDMDHVLKEVMEGKGAMPAWKGILTEEQIKAIFSYLQSQD